MRKLNLLASAAIVAGTALAFTGTAHATESNGNIYLESKCANVSQWYVNHDEGDRKPTVTDAGLVFSTNDLIHHAANLDVADLTHGTFTAAPSPDQNSFFSVEVLNTAGTGYGTLRFNTDSGKWEMTSGGNFFTDSSPVAVVDHFGKSHHVFSMGVGYTNTPPGTVTTTVSAVKFGKHVYSLKCKPVVSSSSASPSPSVSASASHSTSASPSPSHSASHSASAGGAVAGGSDSGTGALAVTGPNGWAIGGTAAVLLAGGASLLFLSRRRKARFVA